MIQFLMGAAAALVAYPLFRLVHNSYRSAKTLKMSQEWMDLTLPMHVFEERKNGDQKDHPDVRLV